MHHIKSLISLEEGVRRQNTGDRINVRGDSLRQAAPRLQNPNQLWTPQVMVGIYIRQDFQPGASYSHLSRPKKIY
ncbi:MAG: hypothetical protein F6K17_13930 [Okeania sp. SIO3C4]|nr:hypothetical protein [Okeania sp. SIO3B3]NER03633.1 hypothetical protein [Okeania sp. SIO3C4]